jgi:hypothetical protein
MSHPQRKLRDLHESKKLSPERKSSCDKTFQAFSLLYQDLENTLHTPYNKKLWREKRRDYMKRLRRIAIVTPQDPEKLVRIKNGLMENAELHFTCLLKPGIPADNNKAERGVAQIVLKRDSCHGSKSDKGARTMGILFTTLLSAKWRKQDNFFEEYEKMVKGY